MEIKSTPKENDKKFNNLLKNVYHICFFVSGQCMIFDRNDDQIVELQVLFTSGESNPHLLKQIAEHAEKFTISKFRHWVAELDKEEFFNLTNLNHI